MTKKENRFETIHSEREGGEHRIIMDKETGVHYYLIEGARGRGGLTPLLGADGKPVIKTLEKG